MLKMIAGAKIENNQNLSQGYEISENQLTANADADNIRNVMENFMDMNENIPLFLFIEVPSNLKDEKVAETFEDGAVAVDTPHKDVYYLDGVPAGSLKKILAPLYEILINDGLSAFGVGNPYGDEIGKYKYNVMVLYSRNNTDKYKQIFENNGILKTDNLVTAWDTFSDETPGTSEIYSDSKGRNIYDIIEVLSGIGLYKAEQREA